MRIPKHLIDLSRVNEINLSGRGGKEREASILLPLWTRVNSSLYDYEITYDSNIIRLEVKKQTNLQWFDSGKYYRLSQIERDIRIMFAIHEDGDITLILVTTLGELIDWLCENRSADGWSDEVLRIAADLKTKYPSLQFKARAHIAAIYVEAPHLFDVIYQQWI